MHRRREFSFRNSSIQSSTTEPGDTYHFSQAKERGYHDGLRVDIVAGSMVFDMHDSSSKWNRAFKPYPGASTKVNNLA
ncbi:hypothetical protein SAMN05518854_1263 [Variovorax sp. YR266]|nr:hypothetical protein SAMN05518854_1263 [Variovorax sp. YR266]